MTEENKELKVVFAPGAFDSFEGTQEELDEMIAEVQAMFEGKTKEEIQSMSRPIDLQELAEDEDISDEEFERIASIVLEDINKPRNLQ
jgi:hypothetical protein